MQAKQPILNPPLRKALIAVGSILVICALCYAAYNLTFWLRNRRIVKEYGLGGAKAPVVQAITLEDYRPGHAITFYGNDGDSIYVEQTRTVSVFSGGVARLEIADSDWFDYDPNQIEGANVTLSPIMVSAAGEKTELPNIELEIPTPESPIVVLSPEEEYMTVNTSVYPVEVQIIPGSTISLNGEDVSADVDRSGLLSLMVNITPTGANTISLLVQTPYHKQARKDIVINRPVMEIALELDYDTPTRSSLSEQKISGKTEPGASIIVDSSFVYDSIEVDPQTGEFSFIAQFSTIGDNLVRFRAVKEGKQDSTIAFNVYYLPSIGEYSRNAWAMDYEQLKTMYEAWHGRIFLCEGVVVDSFVEGTTQYILMDVSTTGEPQLLMLENLSSLGSVNDGVAYKAYADVSGRYFYNNDYIPMLVARYMDAAE